MTRQTDPEKLRNYVELIAKKHGGFEGLRELIRSRLPARTAFALEGVNEEEAAKTASSAVEAFERKRVPGEDAQYALEAIIDAEVRPVIDIINGKFESTHPLWTQLTTDASIRARLEQCFRAIGRIELPGGRIPYGGTGFVVGDGLIMTNRHVAEIFASGLGTRNLRFKPGAAAGIDFKREYGQKPGTDRMVEVVKIVMIHPYWDMALLSVAGLEGLNRLSLSLQDGRQMDGHDIAVVGYPAFDPRNPADVQDDLLQGRYGFKRLQPGELHEGMRTASFKKLVNAATHDCSTLGGNSGSAVIDLSTGQVIALHFGGRYRERNYAVPSFELARDPRVVDAGVGFGGTPKPEETEWAAWWRDADEERGDYRPEEEDDMKQNSSATQVPDGAARGQTLVFEIPIRIRIDVGVLRSGAVTATTAAATAQADQQEAMREPWHEGNYSTRTGYNPGFLNGPGQAGEPGEILVKMPKAKDSRVLAKTKSGGVELKYQNFSILMHAKRRLALVTASNLTQEAALRRPEPGRDYTRKGLSGLGKNDIEQWFQDPRLDAKYQLPDVFFTKDRGAFDKGHLVRREDVAWAETYNELRRANGDTYHVTNCSPQVGAFNQSSRGEGNWGDLENHVLAQAANERLCLFAGPVLDPNDQVFHGRGSGGEILARIPSRFWKVIVCRTEEGIASYGFVLEQDLSDVQFEFVPAEAFLPTMYPLPEISAMTGVSFDRALLDADQYDTVRGTELLRLSGGARTTKTRPARRSIQPKEAEPFGV